ncbi:hypothetical protein EVAR_10603_1 [Eumeta japonica]|uniref:Uncharacterized protein n=1 Tax=Eumeta variegata TaxID=151549 RepID=A0A4C1U227_EUMVA|nr:hypothetical protein EVAR_10603_1 [Eumeta japonica]
MRDRDPWRFIWYDRESLFRVYVALIREICELHGHVPSIAMYEQCTCTCTHVCKWMHHLKIAAEIMHQSVSDTEQCSPCGDCQVTGVRSVCSLRLTGPSARRALTVLCLVGSNGFSRRWHSLCLLAALNEVLKPHYHWGYGHLQHVVWGFFVRESRSHPTHAGAWQLIKFFILLSPQGEN